MSTHGGPRPRVASWPHWYGPNPYLPLLYGALEAHGVDHVVDVPLEPSSFDGPGRRADFLHLHWLYPLFREGRGGLLGRRRRIRDGLGRIRAIRAKGVPVIWTVHNIRPHDGFRFRERGAYASAHSSVDLRLFHSRSAQDEAHVEFGPTGPEDLVVYHGTFADAFPAPRPADSLLRNMGVPDGHRLLLCFGLIRDYKGFDVAARAMASLRRDPIHLLVAGRPVDGHLGRLVRAARAAGNVTVVPGELSAQRVADLVGAADGLVLPYRSITGSGVLLHALTAGKGVVASDLPYFREILEGAPGAGVLVPPGDVTGLAEGIRSFFQVDPGERGAAAARLGQRFAWSDTVRPLATWIHERHAEANG